MVSQNKICAERFSRGIPSRNQQPAIDGDATNAHSGELVTPNVLKPLGISTRDVVFTRFVLLQEGKYIEYPELRDAIQTEGRRVLALVEQNAKPDDAIRRLLRDTTIACLEILTLFGRQECICGKLTVCLNPIGDSSAEGKSSGQPSMWADRSGGPFHIFIREHKTSAAHGPICAVTDELTSALLWKWLVKGRWPDAGLTASSNGHVFNSPRSAKNGGYLTGATDPLSAAASMALGRDVHLTTTGVRRSVETWAYHF